MNHEYKTILIPDTENYKNFVLNEIKEIESDSDESEIILLELIDKLISIQYYHGIFNPDEYDEILSEKINEIYDIEIESDKYSNNEFKYFLKELLESYDIFLSKLKFNTEINESMKIKASYLIENYDYLYYLDEISPEYLNEIEIYESESDLIDYINEMILCHLSYNLSDSYHDRIRKHDLIFRNFNYDRLISDMLINDEIDEIEYDYKKSYVINYNKF